MQRLLNISSSYRGFFQLPPSSKKKFVIGVCAIDVKARSKPMRNILNRLIEEEDGDFDVIIFGDKVILDEDVENWPACDFLLSFFSAGFPLDKAISYVELRKPFCVNDLDLQKVLWDRRLVLSILEAIGVPTPTRLVVSRDGGPSIDPIAMVKLPLVVQDMIKKLYLPTTLTIIDEDTIEIGGVRLAKPFVEKPVYGEDHNINIYYHSSQGGGVRKLFRKIANKSSEYFPGPAPLRTEGSYVYEQFVDVDNAEDIKVYTLGPEFAHAETRKSPVVDGLVRRNVDGKEMRFVTQLSNSESEMASKICTVFGQTVCGLDLLRADGRSFVIDVNGWSFVKGNEDYYDHAAAKLKSMFQTAARRRWFSHFMATEPTFENSWTLKGFISVFRHADRTPKQKAKFKMTCSEIAEYIKGTSDEVIIRNLEEIEKFQNTIRTAILNHRGDEAIKLGQIKLILKKKGVLPGTKVQIKPSYNKKTSTLESMQVIIKWGGEFTHAATHHSSDLGLNMRKDLTIINKTLLEDVKVYSSSERRVIGTADAFIKSFLNLPSSDGLIQVEKEMLDDSNDAKDLTDQVKAELKDLMKEDTQSPLKGYFETNQPNQDPSFFYPLELANKIREALIELRAIMRENMNEVIKEDQDEWCCNDNPQLFKERWEKLILEYCDEQSRFDPGKVCELYDSLKYDALHNREFLERMFTSKDQDYSLDPLKALYKNAKLFFDIIAPREYGITPDEKLSIGMLTSRNLITNIVNDLNEIKASDKPATRLYFTKESHVHTLLNIVLGSDLPVSLKSSAIGELDYLTQITFELYELNRENSEEKEFSLRLGFSPGAHHSFVMDVQIDHHHALSVASRIDLTDHVPLQSALDTFEDLLAQDYKNSDLKSNDGFEMSPSGSPTFIEPLMSPSMSSLNSKASGRF